MKSNYKKKLIEVAIPLEAINVASAREKSIRHGHPSTLHLWWARRPLAACRAILFCQLVDDPSAYVDDLISDEKTRNAAEAEVAARAKKREQDKAEGKSIPADERPLSTEEIAIELERKRLFLIIEELVKWENTTNEEVLERARAEIRRCCGDELPSVYDPFSGGGSIPLEAQRLGLPAYGSDLNPVAVMIGKAMIEIPPKFKDQPPRHPGTKENLSYRGAEGLAEDILYYARILRDKAWDKIGHLYPKVKLSPRDGGGDETVLAWIWARTVASPNPAVGGAHIPLVSTYWLCRKPKKQVWVTPKVDGKAITFEVNYGEPKDADAVAAGTKVGRGANFSCLLTGDAVPADYVKKEGMAGRMGWQLLGIVAEGKGGRRYVSPDPGHVEVAFSEKPGWRPEHPLSQHPQYMSVTNYGPSNVSDLFMDRQTIALNTFSTFIPEVVEQIDAPDEYKVAIATYLALGVSRLANRQSTSTFWHNSGEKVEQVFAMQALPMRWDTAEGNPFSTSSGNFIGQVEYLAKSVAALPAQQQAGFEIQKDAQTVDFTNFVISTDPPYYDNVPYADLSDFFYVWLRRALKGHYPDLFQTVLVPKAEELVADHQRHKGRDPADGFFLDGMTNVMRHMADQGRKDIPAAIYYAFRQGEVDEGGTSSKGWATFLQSVITAGYQVDATWPVRTELVGNLKKNRNALATSVVLSCRKRRDTAEIVTRSEFMRALKRELPTSMKEMQRANIAPVDIPQASIGPGIGIFSRYKSVLESDDSQMTVKTALQIINQQLDEFLSEQEGEFDAETRFALHWFAQNGFHSGAFGDADNLARARGISVDSVKHAGVAESAAGKVRILKREELLEEWDPNTDPHLTVWECCQYLIRALENEGEYSAALLLKKMGADKAEAVKDLAYCLYDICSNKRKDAKEATSYNALIAVWTELTRQAATISDYEITGDRQTVMNI
jgi:putative DNA methylase